MRLRLLAALLSVLASSPALADAVTLKGQVTCSECWFEADRKTTPYGTPADHKCAAKCDKSGIPAALAVAEKGETRLYNLEDGAFKRQGTGWLKYIGQQVVVKGSVRTDAAKKSWLKVDELTPTK